jgi:hypothetical protein
MRLLTGETSTAGRHREHARNWSHDEAKSTGAFQGSSNGKYVAYWFDVGWTGAGLGNNGRRALHDAHNLPPVHHHETLLQ